MPRRHALLAVVVAAAWGFNFVVIEWGLDETPPLLLCALRFCLASLAIAFVPQPEIPWRLIAGVGITLGVVKFGLLFTGMDVGITAGLASLVLQAQVPFTVILAAIVLGERIGAAGIAGLVLAAGGFAVIGVSRGGDVTVTGLVLCVAAGAAWAVANMMMKRASAADPVGFIAWMSLVPILPLLALSLATEHPSLGDLGGRALPAAAYIAFVSTLGGFAAWSWLMRRHDAGKVASFALLVPIFGMTFGALLLGEHLTAAHVAGAALVLGGLALVLAPARKPAVRAEPVPATS